MKKNNLIIIGTSLLVSFIALITVLNLRVYSHKQTKVAYAQNQLVTNPLDEEFLYWEEITRKNPTYLDGWLNLAKTSKLLGKIEYARSAFLQAKSLDPNNIELIKITKQYNY